MRLELSDITLAYWNGFQSPINIHNSLELDWSRASYKGETIYVDHVPAWICSRCGEQYFDAPVYKRLEAIAKQGDRIQETICFPLAEYNMALD